VAGEHVLALDLGTTRVRALVVGADRRIRGRATRDLVSAYPSPGRVEQDPDDWWARSGEVMAEALAAARLGARDLAALGIVSQRATAVAWDGPAGRALAPAIGWQDLRTQTRSEELTRQGSPVSPMASATKFEWLLESVPAVRGASDAGRLRLGTPDAWLGDRLTGGAAFATDPGQASCTGLADARAGRWSERSLARLGLAASWLPAIVATSQVVGETPAALLGAPVPVAARAGDQQAASFAQGVLAAGAGKLTLGTSAMLDVHTGDAPVAPPPGTFPLALWRLAGDVPSYCLEGSVITAGDAIAWLVDLGLLAAPSELDAVARRAEDTAGVSFVPALQGLGTPFLDARARGAWLGLSRGARAPHLVRAVLEGVAQRCADLCEALPLEAGPLRVDGGLAQSDVLVGLLADATGREVLRAAEIETTALGAAELAGLAVGLWSSAAEAVAVAAAPARVAPALEAGLRAERRAVWRQHVDRLRGAG
jgi:glycerol kinase